MMLRRIAISSTSSSARSVGKVTNLTFHMNRNGLSSSSPHTSLNRLLVNSFIKYSFSSMAEPDPTLFSSDRLYKSTDFITIDSSETDKQLRADVKTMGAILGNIIKEYEGEHIFNKVETLRQYAKVILALLLTSRVVNYFVFPRDLIIIFSIISLIRHRLGGMQVQVEMHHSNLLVIRHFKKWQTWLHHLRIMNCWSSLEPLLIFVVLQTQLNFIIAHDEMN